MSKSRLVSLRLSGVRRLRTLWSSRRQNSNCEQITLAGDAARLGRELARFAEGVGVVFSRASEIEQDMERGNERRPMGACHALGCSGQIEERYQRRSAPTAAVAANGGAIRLSDEPRSWFNGHQPAAFRAAFLNTS